MKIGTVVDNIQKSIFAVLGIAGLLVLLVPKNNEQATSGLQPIAPQPLAPIPPAPLNDSEQPAQGDDGLSSEGEEFVTEDELAAFGQPMIDARPIGEREDQLQSQPELPPGAIPAGPNYASGTAPTPEPGPSAQ